MVFAMALTMTACQGKEPKTDNSTGTVAGTTAAKVSEQSTEKNKTITTLEVLVMYSNATAGLENDWMTPYLKDKLGIQLEIIPAAMQKLQALMASGALPDIIGLNGETDINDCIKANLLVPLDEHVDKLPNIMQNNVYEKAIKYYKDNVSNGTGKLFCMPNMVGKNKTIDVTNWDPMLRWDIYQKIGAPAINTLEDYLPVLKQMQDAYPQTADGKKVYAFELHTDWDGITQANAGTLCNFYGYNAEYVNSLVEAPIGNQGEMRTVLDDNSLYKRSLKFYYQANKMGLVDPDSLTQKFDAVVDKFKAGRVLFTPWSFLGDKTKENNDNPEGFATVPANDMKIFEYPDQDIGRPWILGIGAATEKLDKALEFLNYYYSFECINMYVNGPKGVIWDMDSKGVPYVTEQGWDILENNKDMPLPGGGKLNAALSIFNTSPITAYTIDPSTNKSINLSYWDDVINHKPTKLKTDWQNKTGFKTTIDMLTAKNMVVKANPAINMVSPLPEKMQTQMKQIGQVIVNNTWKCMFAKNETDFNKYWKEMQTKADQLGLQQIFEQVNKDWQKALDIYSKYQ
jgi:ABC-type sugar transport system, periplasmic component